MGARRKSVEIQRPNIKVSSEADLLRVSGTKGGVERRSRWITGDSYCYVPKCGDTCGGFTSGKRKPVQAG